MTSRMSDEAYNREQRAGIYLPHVKTINEFVDSLRGRDGRGWLPYVAPMHGGTEARVLSVLRDPGSMTKDGMGSGFLRIENNDPTAANQRRLFASVGITPEDVTPWNAYPWYINRAPNASELEASVDPLVDLIALLPHLRVLLLQGKRGEGRVAPP